MIYKQIGWIKVILNGTIMKLKGKKAKKKNNNNFYFKIININRRGIKFS
jgi:hypothetical protein